MWRSVGLAWLGAAGGVVAMAPACTTGPGREDVEIQRLETQWCEKAVECGCGLGEAVECGGWTPDAFGDDDSLAFDPDCIDRWSTWLDALSCQAPALPRYADLCPLYHGTIREGEPCQWNSLTNTDCGRGLYCVAGSCRDPQRTAFGAPGQPCDLGDRCDGDLECLGSTCKRLPSAGEACLDFRCDADARCESERCVALPGAGQACAGDSCRSGSFCRFDPITTLGECLRLGDVGEPCRGHRECESGNCPAGVCEYPAEVGDACSNQLPCGPGQGCSAGVCQAVDDGAVAIGSACELLQAF